MKKLLLRGASHPSFQKFAQQAMQTCVEVMEARRMLSTTYYVSPNGSDTNAGTSASAPWQTVAKVNATAFLPGDSILFQYGSQYHASLSASSSGSTAAPITYGAYGDSTLANPLFIGSDVLNTSSFTLVTGTTYSMPATTAINWVYDNDEFMRETQDALSASGSSESADPATNIGYVEANAGFFYYDAATTTLYVNRGGSFSEQIISASTRQDAVFNNQQSNLIFTNLDVTETADDGGGYGVRVQSGSNVQVLNSTASLTGKHAFGAIDAPGFLGENLTADQSAPDLGFGGASAFVAYSDSHDSGDTSQWINDTYTNPGGQYPVFVTHGDTNAVGNILLKNIISLGGYGTGMSLQTSGTSQQITIEGGELRGGQIGLTGDNCTIDGMTFDQGTAGITIDGSNNVIQNCVFSQLSANIDAGENGGFDDEGMNNTVRFNTFLLPTGPAMFIRNANASTNIYGNIFDCEYAICLAYVTSGQLSSNDNVFSPGAQFIEGGTIATVFVSLAQWQAQGYDTTSVMADPDFVDATDQNYQLTASSPAIDLYKGTPDASIIAITDDIAGNARPTGAGYDAGAYEFTGTPIVNPVNGSVSVADTTVAAPLPGTTAPALFTLSLSSAQTVVTTVQYATVDGTALAGTDYTAASGTATFAIGATTATVSVLVSPTLAANSSKTFQLTLSDPTVGLSLGTATATATVSNANQTTVAFNKKTPAIYTDATGKKVTMKIGGIGSGTALFVTGNADPVQILLTGTTPASTFSVTSIGGATTIEDIVIQGPIGSITTTANLAGSLEITGAIARLTLGNLDAGASVLLDSAASRSTVKVGAATTATLTSASPIASLTAASWSGSITAPSITSMAVKGAFGSDLNLTGSGVGLASAKVGSITGGTWTIAGATSTVSAASITNLTATFTGGVGSVAVIGAVTGSSLRSGGNIAKVTIGAAVDSTFFAGVASTITALPTATTDFSGNNQIGSFVITAPRTFTNAFSDSFVAAAKIVSAKVQRVQTANNSTPFGFATESVGAFTDVETGKKTFSWNSHKATSLLTFAGDFKVSVI